MYPSASYHTPYISNLLGTFIVQQVLFYPLGSHSVTGGGANQTAITSQLQCKQLLLFVYAMLYCLILCPYSAGINFSRQILTSKIDPRTVRVNIFLMAVDP